MKITAFNGAMRGRKSITHLMVETFLEGAAEAGAEVENVVLVEKKIRRCIGCLQCWLKTPGVCVQKDDMAPLLETYLASDIIVMASPVYVDNVTGLTKDFMDRLIPITDPHFELDGKGETCHVKKHDHYPGIVGMSNCGYPEQSAFDVIRLLFPRIARNMNAEYIAGIYRGGGGILGLDEPALAPMVEAYKTLLRKAGAEIAANRRLSEETAEALEAQMVPTELYNAQVNLLWDRLLPKTD